MLIRNLPQLAKIGTMGKEGVHSKKSIKKKSKQLENLTPTGELREKSEGTGQVKSFFSAYTHVLG